ncbi:MAG: fatty acid/phospholipid synthesis protein PlsX [Ruminococcus sp.]|nr:fatty acid/phospholipid synthesis protein PlsX [Ruminococcus sp.]
MELSVFFKSVIDADNSAIVLCDINHTIIYMNPSAVERYSKWGGEELIGHSLLACHNEESNSIIRMVVLWFGENKNNNRVFTLHNEKENKDVYMIALRDDTGNLIGYYEKHEYRNPETSPRYNMD